MAKVLAYKAGQSMMQFNSAVKWQELDIGQWTIGDREGRAETWKGTAKIG